jgi:DNA-binding NarL/FixJ family response regulator
VRREVWYRRPDHAFRRGFKTGLLARKAIADAVDFLQGHVGGGARARYIDAWQALPLRETIAMVPPLPAPTASASEKELAQILAWKAEGLSNAEIGARLGVTGQAITMRLKYHAPEGEKPEGDK